MGQTKLLLELDGRSVVGHAVEGLLAGGVDRVLVVVGPRGEAVRAALSGLGVGFAVNPSPEEGQGSSIRAGIAGLSAGADAALIALGDQPRIAPQVVPGLLGALRRSGKPIIAPRYREGQGNPVLFRRTVFPELLVLAGNQGARPIIQRDPSRVELVDFDLPMPVDVDTPEDYDRLRSDHHPV